MRACGKITCKAFLTAASLGALSGEQAKRELPRDALQECKAQAAAPANETDTCRTILQLQCLLEVPARRVCLAERLRTDISEGCLSLRFKRAEQVCCSKHEASTGCKERGLHASSRPPAWLFPSGKVP